MTTGLTQEMDTTTLSQETETAGITSDAVMGDSDRRNIGNLGDTALLQELIENHILNFSEVVQAALGILTGTMLSPHGRPSASPFRHWAITLRVSQVGRLSVSSRMGMFGLLWTLWSTVANFFAFCRAVRNTGDGQKEMQSRQRTCVTGSRKSRGAVRMTWPVPPPKV